MKLAKWALLLSMGWMLSIAPAMGQETEEEIIELNKKSWAGPNVRDLRIPYLDSLKGKIALPYENLPPNTMLPPMSAKAKMATVRTMMATNPMGLRHMINFMVAKKKALPGISFDEVIESVQSKALDLNMRPTGHNTPYKVLRKSFDPNSPRLEFLSFCDLITMRMILDFSLEFSAFVPCRIAVMEDAKGDIWLTTLDWDVRWLDTSPNPNRISDDLRQRALRVRENIELIMQAGATGDF